MKKIILLFLVMIMGFSCLSMENSVRLNDDGSGSINIVYCISRDLVSMGNYGKHLLDDLFLPVSRQDFETLLIGRDTVRLVEHSVRDDGEEVVVTVVFEFKTMADLAFISGLEEGQVSLKREGQRFSFHEEIEIPADLRSREGLAGIEELLEDDYLSFTITVPGEIRESATGKVKPDKRSVFLKVLLKDVLTSGKNLVFDIKW